jgi:hypothetical protein
MNFHPEQVVPAIRDYGYANSEYVYVSLATRESGVPGSDTKNEAIHIHHAAKPPLPSQKGSMNMKNFDLKKRENQAITTNSANSGCNQIPQHEPRTKGDHVANTTQIAELA